MRAHNEGLAVADEQMVGQGILTNSGTSDTLAMNVAVDDADGGVDCGASRDGNAQLAETPALLSSRKFDWKQPLSRLFL